MAAKKFDSKKFLGTVNEYLAKGKVYQPADKYIEGMNLCTEYHGRSQDRLVDILKMVDVVRTKSKSVRKAWLKKASNTADRIQLASREWISSNLDELPPLKIVESKEYDPLAGQRDIRFYPSASASASASSSTPARQEQSLMDEGEILEHSKEGEVLDVGLSKEEEEFLLKSPSPSKTSSPRRSPRLQRRNKRKPKKDDRVDNSSSTRGTKKYRHLEADDRVDNSSSTSGQKEDQQESRMHSSEVDDRVGNSSSSSGQRSRQAERSRTSSGRSDRSSKSTPYREREVRPRLEEQPKKHQEDSKSSKSHPSHGHDRREPEQRQTEEPMEIQISESRVDNSDSGKTDSQVPRMARVVSKPRVGNSGLVDVPRLSITTQESGRRVHIPTKSELQMDKVREVKKVVKEKRIRYRKCSVEGCTSSSTYAKAHAFDCHIPPVFREQLPATEPDILRSRTMALKQVARWLQVIPASLEELMRFVDQQHMLNAMDNTSISPRQMEMMARMCDYHHLPVPDRFTMYPVNSPGVLVHWRVLLLLAACLEEEDRVYWINRFQVPEGFEEFERIAEVAEPEPEPEPSYPEVFDSHFHLDRVLRDLGISRSGSIKDVWNHVPIKPEDKTQMVGGVHVYCDPKTYPSSRRLMDLPAGQMVAVGFHPRHAGYKRQSIQDYLSELRVLLDCPRVVALGEIGLDHTEPTEFWHLQLNLLQEVLPLLRDNHVLVIHCRGMKGDCGTEVYLLLLHYLRKAVSTHHPIHLHCFTGNEYVLQRWLEAFPRTYFGFTSLIWRFSENQISVIRSIEESRLLLETDAPYFAPPGMQFSVPGLVYPVARILAEYREVSAEHILEVTMVNGQRLYQ